MFWFHARHEERWLVNFNMFNGLALSRHNFYEFEKKEKNRVC